jgi:hypothetical protein
VGAICIHIQRRLLLLSSSPVCRSPPLSPAVAVGVALVRRFRQVGYVEGGQEFTLYLVAAHENEREDWIRVLRAG